MQTQSVLFDIHLLYHNYVFGYGIFLSKIFFIIFLMYVECLINIHVASLLVTSSICILLSVLPVTLLLSGTFCKFAIIVISIRLHMFIKSAVYLVPV